MRIKIIGNSHLLMLMESFDAVRPAFEAVHGPTEVSAFGVSGRFCRMCTVDESQRFGWHHERRLEHAQPDDLDAMLERANGTTFIDLSDADIVICVGLFAPLNWVIELLASAVVEGLNETDVTAPRVSRATFERFVEALQSEMATLDHLAHVDASHRFALNGPMPSAKLTRDPERGPRGRLLAALAQNSDAFAPVHASIENWLGAGLVERGLTYLSQPPDTKAAVSVSLPEFMGTETTFAGKREVAEDLMHGSKDMGALIWRDVMHHL